MSKRTFIPKFNKDDDGGISSKYRKKSCFPNFMEVKLMRDGEKEQNKEQTVQWYGNRAATSKYKPENRNNAITEGRLTQRVGMFRNAKQSEVIYNSLPSTNRRAVNRHLEKLVAPEKDVEWVRSNNVVRMSQHLEDEDFHNEEERTDIIRKKKTIMVDSPIDDITSFANDGDDNQYDNPTKRARVDIVDDYTETVTTHVRRDTQLHQRIPSTPSRQKTASFDNDTPTRNTSSLVFPSKEIASRAISSLCPVYLRDDDVEDYSSLTLQLMTESLTNKDNNSECNIINSLVNQTVPLAISEEDSDEADSGCPHDYVFPLTKPPRDDIMPPTPALERLFNETVSAQDKILEQNQFEDNNDEEPDQFEKQLGEDLFYSFDSSRNSSVSRSTLIQSPFSVNSTRNVDDFDNFPPLF